MKNKLPTLLSCIVILVGLIVIIGWFMDISLLKSIMPNWVTMKFSTAVSFVLSGILVLTLSVYQEKKLSITPVIILMCSTFLLMIKATLFFSIVVGLNTGIETLFVKEAAGAVQTTSQGRASLVTMLNFVLIAIVGILWLANQEKTTLATQTIGGIITLVGVVASIGYGLNMPALYYSFPDVSTAMAIHTALLFILLGIGLLHLPKNSA